MFLSAAAGATPLSGQVRVPPPRPPEQVIRPEPLPPTIALTLESDDRDDGADGAYGGVAASGRAPGVNRAQLASLRGGRVRPEATLDLHGQTVAQALPALERFLLDAAHQRLRCVLVVHGKGLHSEGVAVLRDAVLGQLATRMSGLVHAFCRAAPPDGGAGATYVMVRR